MSGKPRDNPIVPGLLRCLQQSVRALISHSKAVSLLIKIQVVDAQKGLECVAGLQRRGVGLAYLDATIDHLLFAM
jgi:hypothetical protein